MDSHAFFVSWDEQFVDTPFDSDLEEVLTEGMLRMHDMEIEGSFGTYVLGNFVGYCRLKLLERFSHCFPTHWGNILTLHQLSYLLERRGSLSWTAGVPVGDRCSTTLLLRHTL